MNSQNVLTSPRNKLLVASVCIGCLCLWACLEHLSPMMAARGVLGASAVAGLTVWARWAASRRRVTFARPARLEVVQRVGLTQRTGVALVEIDGQPYLIVHGDGFARVRQTGSGRQLA